MPKLSPETIDGLEFGLKLASNPKIRARREAWEKQLAANLQRIKGTPIEDLRECVYAIAPTTIPELLNKRTQEELEEKIMYYMQIKACRKIICEMLEIKDED